MNLTARQSDTLAFIKAFQAENGFGPSYREIGKAIGLSSVGRVHRLMACLEERGAIRKMHNRPRSVEIVEDADFHLRAVLASFSPNGILFAEDRAVVAAREYLERRPS